MGNAYGTYNPLAPDPVIEERRRAFAERNQALQDAAVADARSRNALYFEDPSRGFLGRLFPSEVPKPVAEVAPAPAGPPAPDTTGAGASFMESITNPFVQFTPPVAEAAPAPAEPAPLSHEGQPSIAEIRAAGNVTENRAGGLRGADWLASGGGGSSNWTGRMAAADHVDPIAMSAAHLPLERRARADREQFYGTTEENAFDPRRSEFEDLTHAVNMARGIQQLRMAELTPQEMANLEMRPDSRVSAFQFGQRLLGTPEQAEQDLIDQMTAANGGPLKAEDIAALRLAARGAWNKKARDFVMAALTQRQPDELAAMLSQPQAPKSE